MAPQWNEYDYAKEFDGNLNGQVEPVPARVTTRLRMMGADAAREIRMYSASHKVPLYAFQVGGNKDLPMHPSLEATGRHFFTFE
jgi:hypothetical protein